MEQDIKKNHSFFLLLQAGLWERDILLSSSKDIDYKEIYRISQEQAVVGIIAAGLEHIVDVKLPKDILLTFVGETLQLEQRNTAMNSFIVDIFKKLQKSNNHLY